MIKNLRRLFVFGIFLLSTSLWAAGFSVVSYNVENLFDSQHDEKHEDFTYLPLKDKLKEKCKEIKNSYYRKYCQKLDWSPKKVEKKVIQHRKVIEALPLVPDFLGLIEIENLSLVKKFEDLVPSGKSLITVGDDERGINCGLIYNSKKFKLISTQEIFTLKGSRNTLEAVFESLNSKGKKVILYVNHWPSQRSPTEKRVVAAEAVATRVKEWRKKDPSISHILVGDYNTLEIEQPHPFYNALFEGTGLKDSADKTSGGSYFYKPAMSWNLLDRIFFSDENLKLKEFKVFKPDFITTVTEYKKKGKPFWGSRITGIPKGAEHKSLKDIGYSDHFPVYATFDWGK